MKDQRPKNLDLFTIRFPITAITSILHRASGVFIFLMIPVLLSMLACSLASEESFNQLKSTLDSVVVKLGLWIVITGILYHMVAGIRHIVMDFGFGETLAGGHLGAKLIIVISALLSLMVGVWLW